MRLPLTILNQKIKDLGLIDENGKPISFAKFKQRVAIHQYGKGQRRLFILFIGHPKENLLAFYPPTDTRPSMLKIAYEYLVDTITQTNALVSSDMASLNLMFFNSICMILFI